MQVKKDVRLGTGTGGEFDPIRAYEKEFITMFEGLKDEMGERGQRYLDGLDNAIEDWIDISKRLEMLNEYLKAKIISKMGTIKASTRRGGNGNNNKH